MQNYSNNSRLYVISNCRHSSATQTNLHQQTTKSKSSPDPVFVKKTLIRFLPDPARVRVQKVQNQVHAHLWFAAYIKPCSLHAYST